MLAFLLRILGDSLEELRDNSERGLGRIPRELLYQERLYP
jgi:hypothetical protein